jgi:ACS family glucarate transporter-like MFS transporter
MAESKTAAEKPTSVRWRIVALLTLIMAATALGRLNLSIAGKSIQDEFRFSDASMGWILGAFAFGYALCQVPCGWAGDRFGPRGTLTVAILWWAGFTGLMMVVPAFHAGAWMTAWLFGIVRLFTGAGEAASYPNANKVIAYWTAPGERGMGSSLLFGGVGVGGIVAPLLLWRFVHAWGWRSSFLLCAGVAAAVALAWYVYATDHPEQHPRINAAELAVIGGNAVRPAAARRPTPWRALLSSGSVWGLLVSYFCHGYTPYIFYTWFFIYLVRVRHLSVTKGGVWGSTPFIAIALMAPMGGWLSDRAVERYGHGRGRRGAAMLGMALSALLLWAGSRAANTALSVSELALAAGFSAFAGASWWAACIDLAPDHSGSLSGLMNTCANIAGGIAPIVTAYVATAFGWTRALELGALITFTGGLLWIFVDAGKSLETRWNAAADVPVSDGRNSGLGPGSVPVN